MLDAGRWCHFQHQLHHRWQLLDEKTSATSTNQKKTIQKKQLDNPNKIK
jgi:hypothetical protein